MCYCVVVVELASAGEELANQARQRIAPVTMFQLKNIKKSFGEVAVIRDMSLNVQPGKTTALIGPSGCGKSTCLRLFIGLITPDSGEVLFDSKPVTPDNMRDLRRRIGYVIQHGGLFPHMTARDNVTLLAREMGRSLESVGDKLDTLVEMTNFPADGLDRYPAELSGGQRQRVALMRALLLEPKALLLDEPLGALDPMIRYDLQRDLRRIFRSLEKTVIIVTHDLAEAHYFADEIVLMRDGKIAQRGTLDEMSKNPAEEFVSKFITAQRGVSFDDEDVS